MCSRDFSTAMCCSSLIRFGSTRLKTPPSPACAAVLPSAPLLALTCPSDSSWTCCSFSSVVIRRTRWSTFASMPRSAALRAGLSAASSLDTEPATTAPATIELSATTDTAIAATRLLLRMSAS